MTQSIDTGLLPVSAPVQGGWTRERAFALAILAVYVGVLATGWFSLSRLLPDHITLSLFGHSKTINDIQGRVLRDGGVLLAILPLALWLEWMTVGWSQSSLRRMITAPTASMRTDLAVLVLGQGHVLDLAGKVMMLGASMISGDLIRSWLVAHTGFAIDPGGLPFALQVLVFFYVYTFFDYWTHRIDHSRWFWPLHRYHHSAEDFCVVTTARQHPAAFVGILVINVPLAILGASPEVMIFVNVIVTAIGFVIHSQMNSDWGWVGRWVVQSPQHHRLHHKLDMTEKTGHFAMAPVWDRLFGTWYDNAAKYPDIGVAKPYRHGLWVAPDMLRDYLDFWKGLVIRNTDPA